MAGIHRQPHSSDSSLCSSLEISHTTHCITSPGVAPWIVYLAESPASIGENKCFLERMRQHKNDARKMEVQCSALVEHCEKYNLRLTSTALLSWKQKKICVLAHTAHTGKREPVPENNALDLHAQPPKRKGKIESGTRCLDASLTIAVTLEEGTKRVLKRLVLYKIIAGGYSIL